MIEDHVRRQLSSICVGKATGLDRMPARFLRDGAGIISRPVTHIINLSLCQGKVPDDFKLARVVPLHKKNSRTDVGELYACINPKYFI